MSLFKNTLNIAILIAFVFGCHAHLHSSTLSCDGIHPWKPPL